MPSTYTLNNGIELVATGEQSGTWGDTTNTNFTLLDTSLDGQVTVTLGATGSSGSPNALPVSDGATSNGRNRLIIFADSGDLGGTAFVQLTPNDAEKIIYVRNNLSGSRSILLFQGTYSASNDYEVPAGTTSVVFFNGAGSGAVAANVFNNAHFDAMNVVGSVTITTDDNSDTLSLVSTDADANSGPNLNLYRNSASPANNDFLGNVKFVGRNNNSQDVQLAEQEVYITDVTDGAEDGLVNYNVMTNGSNISYLQLRGETGTVVFNEDSNDLDFRIESNAHANMFVVDGGNDAAGIGVYPSIDWSTNYPALQMGQAGALYGHKTSNQMSYAMNWGVTTGNVYIADGMASRMVMDTSKVAFDTSASGTAGNGITGIRNLEMTTAANVFNEESNDMDFRVESDDVANMLFLDAENNRLNIGGSPNTYSSNRVNIFGANTNPPSSANGNLAIYATDSQAAGNGGCITFGGRYTDAGAMYQFGAIQAVKKNGTSGNAAGLVKLYYVDSSNGTNAFLEASEDGAVFNEASLDDDFRIESNNNTHMLFVDGGNDNLIVGNTVVNPASGYSNQAGLGYAASGQVQIAATSNLATLVLGQNQGTNGSILDFRKQGTVVGSVSVTGSGTTYNTTSDRRLKENIEPIADATDKLMSMKPVTHTWKADPDADAVHGFIAQEMQDIVPEAVSGEPDDEEMMSMDYGRITPVLVAALQDAHKKIEVLEARLTELENK